MAESASSSSISIADGFAAVAGVLRIVGFVAGEASTPCLADAKALSTEPGLRAGVCSSEDLRGVADTGSLRDSVEAPTALMADWPLLAGDWRSDALSGVAPGCWDAGFAEAANSWKPSPFLAGDFIAPWKGVGGGLFAGLQSTFAETSCVSPAASLSGDACFSTGSEAASALLCCTRVLDGGGRTGFFFSGVFSGPPASSSSDSTSRAVTCAAFLGLSGILSAVFALAFVALVPRVARAAGAVVVAVVLGAAAAAPRRTGRPRRPVAGFVSGSLPFVVPGSMFSFSGSWNVTVFLMAGLVVAAARVLVVLEGSAAVLGSSFSWVFLGRPRLGLGCSTACSAGSAVVFFALVALVAALVAVEPAEVAALRRAGLGAGSVGSSAAFLGRPRCRAVFITGAEAISSSSVSSARVFLLAEVVLVVVVVAAAFALEAAVVVCAVDFPEVSLAFAAARARVIRLGGDWVSMLGRFDGDVWG